MSGPQTEAGRALLDDGRLPMGLTYGRDGSPIIEAIEREAVAAFLASPETAEALARALGTDEALAALDARIAEVTK